MPPITAALLLGAFAAPISVQADAEPDRVYLVRDILRWNGAGGEAERGSLLIQDGHVAWSATGFDAGDYPEARVVDAEEDWMIYPGRVNAGFQGSFGDLPANPYVSEKSDASIGPVPAMELGDRASFRGWMYAADVLDWDASSGDDWRDAGYTSAYVFASTGLVQGHAAWIAWNGRPLGDALLERDGMSSYSLSARVNGYPRTPMAALATHRQLIYDAAAGPGFDAPDIRLADVRVFRADGARAIENVLDLHESSDAKLILLGGREAWKHAERLKAADVAVLYRLSISDAPDEEDDDAADLDGEKRPYWRTTAKQREGERTDHLEDVKDFLKLREAGVQCALLPAGSAKDFAEDLEQLIEAGASEEDLRIATTSDPRTILGLEGMRADFVISRGELSLTEPDLAWAFVQDRAFEFSADDEDSDDDEGDSARRGGRRGEGRPGGFRGRRGGVDGPTQSGGPDAALAGEWKLTVESPMGEFHFNIAVDLEESSIKMFEEDSPSDRTAATKVSIDGKRLRFTFSPPEMGGEMSADIKLSDGKLSGDLATPFGEVPLTGVKRGGGGDQEAESEEQEDESDSNEDKFGNALGHPEYPVEIIADRLPPSAWAQERGGSMLLRGGTLYPVTGADAAIGDLLIVDGVIKAMGSELEAREGVPVIDATGWHVMPGVIDAHSHLALDSINEGSMAITCECQIIDMIHPESTGIWRAAAGGTTLVQSLHGSANPIGGQAAVWEMDYWDQAIGDLLYPGAKQGVKFALGENVKRGGGRGGGRFPGSRMGVEAVFRRGFQDALAYKEQRRLHEEGRLPGFRRDVRLETLAAIIDNEIHVQCHSYRADEIYMMLRVCKEFGIKAPTFQHVLEGYKVAPEMAAYGAMASTFSDWWAYKYEVKDAIPWNVEIMHKAGITVSINSDSDEMIRRLNTEAGKSLRYGSLSYSDAMATTTLNSAKQLRIDDRLGSLEIGKDGSITVYDAPPLSTYARCLLTVARGVVLYEANPAHEQAWQDYSGAAATFAASLQSMEEVEEEPVLEDVSVGAEATEAALTAANQDDDWERWTRPGRGSAYVIENALVHPISGEAFLGSVYVKDGRIAQVGTEVTPDAPCEVVDASGKHLYPGFLDADDTTGLYEIGQVSVSVDQSEIGRFNPDISAAAAVHADSAHHHVTRLTGIAYVLVSPQSGTVRGQSALVQLDGTTTDDLIAVRDLGLHINFPRVRGGDGDKGPDTPDGVEELDEWFDDALAWGERKARLAEAGRETIERRPQMEALLPYARGEKPVFIECSSASQLMMAREWAKKRELDVVYVGGSEAWKVAGYFGADGARMIVGPVHTLPRGTATPFDTPYRLPWVLAEAGCQIALRTNDPEQTRNLPFQAATASAWGLGRERTLRALTLGAAEILGVDRYIGSIEEGKVATFFLADGDPLDFTGKIERMWIGGREIELESKQTKLRERYLQRLGSQADPAREVQ